MVVCVNVFTVRKYLVSGFQAQINKREFHLFQRVRVVLN